MKTNKLWIVFLLSISLFILLSYIEGFVNLTLFIIFLILNLVFHTIIYFYHYKFLREYKKINQTIEGVINDKFDTRLISRFVSYRILNANLNRLVRKINRMSFKNEEDEMTIKILTNNINSPIIYIDRDGRIKYVNLPFLNCFDTPIEINDIYEKLRVKKLFQFIDDAFIFEMKEIKTLLIEDKYYQASAIPINHTINNITSFMGILFIFHDITEIKRYEKLQREFLANASHELKTPLSAIKGASEILLNGEKHTKETINEFLTIIKKENDRMDRIVRDILLISRLENEKFIIKNEKIDINELIHKVINILEFRLKHKNQNLYLDLGNHLIIDGDYERLKHVFLNLVSNAISYTNQNKSIYIRTYQENEQVVFSIKDEGIGIDESELPHIFERFYRVDKARSRETGGTGLGLAIVKSTLDIHKARIEVKSKENEGTEFIIYFNKTLE